jgi:GTPase SAR1 family protein
VLEPKWVTNAVYRIINSEKLAACNGVLKLDLLDEILKKEAEDDYYYPTDKYRYIIDLMKKFELCYEIDKETVLLPDLLEVQEPEFDFDYDAALKFVIDYDFLPRSVMPRFIVKMHKDIASELRWRTGVVLEDKAFHSTAVIRADERDEKIYIYVDGEQKRDYFSAIRKTFRDINASFEKLEAKELVPLPDNDEIRWV